MRIGSSPPDDNVAHFTTNVVIYRQPIFLHPWAADILVENLRFYQRKYSFRLIGYVVMPDHLHTLIWPQPDVSIGSIMRDFKKYASVAVVEALGQRLEAESGMELLPSREPSPWRRNQPVPSLAGMMSIFSYAGRRFRGTRHKVWQDDHHTTLVWSSRVIRQKLRYIHDNPVRWGLVERPEDWKYSSYRALELGEAGRVPLDTTWAT